MPFPARMRRHEEIVELIARDVFGLSLRPRAAEVFVEDMIRIPFPLLELDRQFGLGPQRLAEGEGGPGPVDFLPRVGERGAKGAGPLAFPFPALPDEPREPPLPPW